MNSITNQNSLLVQPINQLENCDTNQQDEHESLCITILTAGSLL